MKKVMLLIALTACGDNTPPPDDGFGVPCNVNFDGQLYTTCQSLLDEQGVCVQRVTGNRTGICRRWCNGDETNPAACPAGQHAIPASGGTCFCEP